MLRKLFGNYPAKNLYLLTLGLSVTGFGTVALAQAVEPFSNTLYAFFSDPVMFSGLVLTVSTWLTELVTDAVKDGSKIKGWHTRGIAAATAAVLAGIGGYFGLSYFTDVSGPNGAATAAGLALASWLGANVKHRAGQLRKSGKRQADRNAPALELPKDVAGYFEIIKNSDLSLEIRRRAVETLKGLNPLLGSAAELLLEQLLTRPLSADEGKAERDAEIERRVAASHE